MTTSISGSANVSGSAKIYTFPARGRYAIGTPHDAPGTAANVQPLRGAKIASSSAWYHDAAIQAEQSRRDS